MPSQTVNSFDEVQIRLATSNDVGDILAVPKSAPEAAQWSREVYAGLFARQEKDRGRLERKIFCAVHSQCLIGFAVVATLVLDDSSQCELENMAVASDWRRRGVGGRLVEAVLDCCRRQGGQVNLEVRKSNTGAILLYESKGFTKIGTRRKYYGDPEEDAIQMKYTPSGGGDLPS